MKTKTKETALSSFRRELTALTNLIKNNDIVIQKSDKGNSAVIVDKDTYIKRMENLLSDQKKIEKVTLKNDAFLNFVVNQEKHIDTIFKKLVDSISMSEEMFCITSKHPPNLFSSACLNPINMTTMTRHHT